MDGSISKKKEKKSSRGEIELGTTPKQRETAMNEISKFKIQPLFHCSTCPPSGFLVTKEKAVIIRIGVAVIDKRKRKQTKS